jgi:hypothetical protein
MKHMVANSDKQPKEKPYEKGLYEHKAEQACNDKQAAGNDHIFVAERSKRLFHKRGSKQNADIQSGGMKAV